MASRTLLGPADVSDEVLTAVVRDQLGVDDATVSTCEVEVAEYDLEALTTAGRYRVRGTAHDAAGERPYRFFVKVVQSWTRTPAFAHVPEHLRDLAAAALPWRVEPTVYRSDLGDRLPDGLSMPRAYAVLDLDDESAALWLDVVDADCAPWTATTFERAAHLLGRLAASPAVRPLAARGSTGIVRSYAQGRLQGQVVPALHSDELWEHPLVAEAFGPELRRRLLAAADALAEHVAELDSAPLGTAHGDACTRNLLVPRGAREGFVMIDFAFFCEAPLGFDLSQLLLGEVQLGERPAAELPALEELCLDAYVHGLRAEGCDVPVDAVRRWHALLLLLFGGLTAVPLEVVHGMPAPGRLGVVRERAAAAAHVLDLVDATGPLRPA